MGLLDRGDGLGKKNLRPLDDPISAAGCFQGGEGSLVNPGHVQRLQPEGHGLASQSTRRLQAAPAGLASGAFATPSRYRCDNLINLRFMTYSEFARHRLGAAWVLSRHRGCLLHRRRAKNQCDYPTLASICRWGKSPTRQAPHLDTTTRGSVRGSSSGRGVYAASSPESLVAKVFLEAHRLRTVKQRKEPV